MRLKPSVRSCVSSASGFFSAASAMVSSQLDSIQVIDVLGDVFGQTKRMLAHQVLGTLSVARLKGLDDVHVVADGAIDPVFFADRLAADHPHVGEEVLGQTDEYLVAAQLDDRLVEVDIDLGVLIELGVQLVVLEGGEDAPEA